MKREGFEPRHYVHTLNADNPSCPYCGHYNALLTWSKEGLQCRDCNRIALHQHVRLIQKADEKS